MIDPIELEMQLMNVIDESYPKDNYDYFITIYPHNKSQQGTVFTNMKLDTVHKIISALERKYKES